MRKVNFAPKFHVSLYAPGSFFFSPFFLPPFSRSPSLLSLPADCSSAAPSHQLPHRHSYCTAGCSSYHTASARPLLRRQPQPHAYATWTGPLPLAPSRPRITPPELLQSPCPWLRHTSLLLGATPLPQADTTPVVAMPHPRCCAAASCLGPARLGSASARPCRPRPPAHHDTTAAFSALHHMRLQLDLASASPRHITPTAPGLLLHADAPPRPPWVSCSQALGHATRSCPSCMHAPLGHASSPRSARPRSRVTEPPRRSSRPLLALGLTKPPHAPQRPRRHRHCSSPSLLPSSRPQRATATVPLPLPSLFS